MQEERPLKVSLGTNVCICQKEVCFGQMLPDFSKSTFSTIYAGFKEQIQKDNYFEINNQFKHTAFFFV